MSKRARWLVGTVVVLLALIYTLFGNPFDPFDNRRFSKEKWEHSDYEGRARMSRDLITRVIRPGMSEDQVVGLLGPPMRISDTRGPSEQPIGDNHICEYYLGSWSLHGMDDAYLYVRADRAKKVVSAEIYGY